MEPKFIFASVKAAGPGETDWDIEVVCSTDAVDRSGEIIDQRGWDLKHFLGNPVFLAAHLHRLADGGSPVIGSFRSIAVENGALTGRVKFASTPLAQEYKSLYAEGHMRAVSVGFMPGKSEPRTVDGKRVPVITSGELYEVSAVAVPANPEALARVRELMARQLGDPPAALSAEQLAAIQADLAGVVKDALAARPADGPGDLVRKIDDALDTILGKLADVSAEINELKCLAPDLDGGDPATASRSRGSASHDDDPDVHGAASDGAQTQQAADRLRRAAEAT